MKTCAILVFFLILTLLEKLYDKGPTNSELAKSQAILPDSCEMAMMQYFSWSLSSIGSSFHVMLPLAPQSPILAIQFQLAWWVGHTWHISCSSLWFTIKHFKFSTHELAISFFLCRNNAIRYTWKLCTQRRALWRVQGCILFEFSLQQSDKWEHSCDARAADGSQDYW